MGNLIVKCFGCGAKIKLYADDVTNDRKRRCPYCLAMMDERQFAKLENAFNTIEEVNYGLQRVKREKGATLFQVGYEAYYVHPERFQVEDE